MPDISTPNAEAIPKSLSIITPQPLEEHQPTNLVAVQKVVYFEMTANVISNVPGAGYPREHASFQRCLRNGPIIP